MTERLTAGDNNHPVVPGPGTALGVEEPFGALQEVPEQSAGAGVPIARLVSAVLRYKWLVLAISGAGIAGSVIATKFIEPEFVANATIYISNQTNNRQGPISSAELLAGDNWVQLVRTFAVTDPVVRKTRLYLNAAKEDSPVFEGLELDLNILPGKYTLQVNPDGRTFALSTARGRVETGSVGDSIGRVLGLRWAPNRRALGKKPREIPFTLTTPRDASVSLLSRLKTLLAGVQGNNANFMVLTMSDSDPDRAAKVLNALLDQFVNVAADLKKAKITELTQDLAEQLRIADSTLRASESSLETFRVETITQPREDQSPVPTGLDQGQGRSGVTTNYFQKRLALSAILKDRKEIEEVLRRGREQGMVPVDAFHTIAAVKQAPDLVGVLAEVSKTESEIRALRVRYTDDYKGIKDLLAQLDELKSKTVPEYAQRLVEQLKNEEVQLQAEVDAEGTELRKIPVRTLTEDKLRRASESSLTLFRNLQGRYQEAKLAELSATPDVRILDRAEAPTTPSSNTAPRIILMGVSGSVGVALLLAILLDRLDKRFRYPEQATHDLGLTILGAVPGIRRQRGGGVMAAAEQAQIIEAFRSIRLNLAHSFPAGEPIVVTVTSPSPGDGKSLIAANLAISFADAGYQTLLLDGDTRRGDLFRMFGAEKRPGLLDYLEDTVSMERLLAATSHQRLTLIPCGGRNTRGPELLGSGRMQELMVLLRARFQVILVDSPPLGAGIDPFVLATVTGNVMIVLRAGETDRQLAHAKLQLLSRLPTRQIGAVLNHIDVGHGSYKYYAYEYTYTPGPDSEEEAPRPPQPVSTLPGGS